MGVGQMAGLAENLVLGIGHCGLFKLLSWAALFGARS